MLSAQSPRYYAFKLIGEWVKGSSEGAPPMLRTFIIVSVATAALIGGLTADALAYGGGGFSRGGFGSHEHVTAGSTGGLANGHSRSHSLR
jgi:hypothetical protein